MSDRILDVIRKVITSVLALSVIAASARQYAIAYRLTEPDPRWAVVASVVVVGTILLALLYPTNAASRVGFWGLLLAAGAAWIVNAATPLGLTQYSPLAWRGLILAMVALPAPIAFWVLKEAVAPKAPPKVKALGSGRKSPKVDRKRFTFGGKPKVTVERKRPQELANPESESPPESIESLVMLNETLEVVRQHKGNMAAAARALGLTPPGVGDRLKRLYKVNPDQVRRYAPEWVKRNIKEEVDA
jgi:hypothetical protein